MNSQKAGFVLFLLYRKIRPIKQKTLREDAHLADMKFVALQHRSGAKESQATLCSGLKKSL
jgi:hypothetical protein